MAITIIRRTGVIRMTGALAIRMNGVKVGQVRTEQRVKVNLPSNTAKLKISQSIINSNELAISDGETIEVTTPKWSGFFLFLIIIFPSLLNFIPNFNYQISTIVVYVMVVMIMLFSIKWYKIKKVN
ncbi:MAG: hypothetical protein KC455_02400 [Carnobacterium sp.]|nr:hypothetical protein [Carnobacterium sp.]